MSSIDVADALPPTRAAWARGNRRGGPAPLDDASDVPAHWSDPGQLDARHMRQERAFPRRVAIDTYAGRPTAQGSNSRDRHPAREDLAADHLPA
jgi:hypothetical protein